MDDSSYIFLVYAYTKRTCGNHKVKLIVYPFFYDSFTVSRPCSAGKYSCIVKTAFCQFTAYCFSIVRRIYIYYHRSGKFAGKFFNPGVLLCI